MKCLACDTLLTDYEATLRNVDTLEYISECLECIRNSNGVFDLHERLDLKTVHDIDLDTEC
jgi:hypothetical protein